MTRNIKNYLLLFLLLLTVQGVMAQTTVDYKVKKKETLFGISRDHNITVKQLIEANPEMNNPDYKLKKGSVIKIPVVATGSQTEGPSTQAAIKGAIHLGVMLPLHDNNGDGRRMVEYYRGVLLACETLKKEGISVDVRAWNLAEDGNVNEVLANKEAAGCDLIIGPLYSKFMGAMSDFTSKHDIMLVVPFSINAPQLYSNKRIFQIYQPLNTLVETTARRCTSWFKDYHFIIVDCQDSKSTKGQFTSSLRRQLDVDGIRYNLTSLQSGFDNFSKAFVDNAPNMVILNTESSPQLIEVFAMMKNVLAARPRLEISMFGYNEWLMYANQQKQNFHRYNVYIPSPYFTNTAADNMKRIERNYRANFQTDMQQALPRFAVTGYDHATFFLRGLHKYGKTFDGAAGRIDFQPVQTPLRFERIGNGGFQNRSYLFIHYKPDGTIDTLNY